MDARQAKRTVERIARDPVFFSRHVLGVEPWAKQEQILNLLRDNTRVSVRSCHGAGKSFISACAVLWYLFSRRSIIVTTAPTSRQVKGILWREIARIARDSRVALGGQCLTTIYRLDVDHFALGFTAQEFSPTKFQGWHAPNILAVVDEAAGVAAPIYDQGISAITSSEGAKQLLIGNPTEASGEFYETFRRSRGARVKISAFDTPNFRVFGLTIADFRGRSDEWRRKIDGRPLPAPWLVTPQWVADRLDRWGEDSAHFRARVLAEFPVESGESVIGPLAWCDRAMESEPLLGDGRRIMGVDVARSGKNRTVLAIREGDHVRIHSVHSGLLTTEVTRAVIKAVIDQNVQEIRIDPIGVGAGVYDQIAEATVLSSLGIRVREANAAGHARDKDRFTNARAEWFWYLRRALETSSVSFHRSPETELVATQLSNLRYGVGHGGRITVESKDSLASRGYESPDEADAVAFCFAPTEPAFAFR